MTPATLPRGTTDETMSRLFPEPARYLRDPVAWMHDVAREETWSKSEEILQSVLSERSTAVHACHDSGKSHTASRAIGWWIDQHPLGEAFVVSTAPTQTQVEAILWREIGRVHRKADLPGRITSGSVPMWKLGQEIVGYGRKPQDLASKEEAMAAFQGIHARYVLVVIDEAGGVPKWLFDAVDTLVTNENARVLAIGNPDDGASHFAKICKPGSDWNVIRISYEDTPAFTGEKVSDSLLELLISPTWVREREVRWGKKSPLYISKVLGLFPEVSDDTLLSPAWIRKCQENDLSSSRELGTVGVDVARYGTDETVAYWNRGGHIRRRFAHHKQDTMQTAQRIFADVGRHKGGIRVVVDEDGLGAGVVDRLRQLRLKRLVAFMNGGSPHDKRRFINRRAEMYWDLREAGEDGLIDLPADGEDDDLIAQLGSIRWYTDSRGRIGIESKDDMKKRGLPSPDRADALAMSTVSGPGPIVLDEPQPGRPQAQADETSDLMTKEW